MWNIEKTDTCLLLHGFNLTIYFVNPRTTTVESGQSRFNRQDGKMYWCHSMKKWYVLFTAENARFGLWRRILASVIRVDNHLSPNSIPKQPPARSCSLVDRTHSVRTCKLRLCVGSHSSRMGNFFSRIIYVFVKICQKQNLKGNFDRPHNCHQ